MKYKELEKLYFEMEDQKIEKKLKKVKKKVKTMKIIGVIKHEIMNFRVKFTYIILIFSIYHNTIHTIICTSA